jgi:UvrD-like helicase C-terminal domain
LAARRAEVDRLNTLCQELLAARGRLGDERLQVEDRQLAVGDRVVCGKNAIAELGVANGSRGTITALDPQARTLTMRLDGTDGRMVILPQSYVDGRGRGERNRRVDLAYATTGHRAQGLTRGRALVRLTGSEDVNWLYVQLSRARQEVRLYAVVGPEPQGGGELDLPDREQPDGYVQLAQALARAGGQSLALDTPSSPDLLRLSTAELRAERDRLRRQLDQAPRDRSRELERASVHRQQVEQALAAYQPATGRQPAGMLGWLGRADDQPTRVPGGVAVASQQANRAHDRERELRQHQQRRDGWLEANSHLGPAYRQVVRTLAWQRRATGLAVEADRPGYVLEALGPVPDSTRGRRAWRHAAAQIEQYRRSYNVTDPDRALGTEPDDPAQRADRQRAHTAIEWIHAKQRAADRSRDPQPTSERTNQPRSDDQRGRRGPERAAG